MNDSIEPKPLLVTERITAKCPRSTTNEGHVLNVFNDVKAGKAREYCVNCKQIFDIEDMRKSQGTYKD